MSHLFAISGWICKESSNCISPLNSWFVGQMFWGLRAKAGSREVMLLCSLYRNTWWSLSPSVLFEQEVTPTSIHNNPKHCINLGRCNSIRMVCKYVDFKSVVNELMGLGLIFVEFNSKISHSHSMNHIFYTQFSSYGLSRYHWWDWIILCIFAAWSNGHVHT